MIPASCLEHVQHSWPLSQQFKLFQSELNLPMPLKIAVREGIGFRQDQLLALAIASNTTSTSMTTTTFVPLDITSQGMVAT